MERLGTNTTRFPRGISRYPATSDSHPNVRFSEFCYRASLLVDYGSLRPSAHVKLLRNALGMSSVEFCADRSIAGGKSESSRDQPAVFVPFIARIEHALVGRMVKIAYPYWGIQGR